MQCLYKRNISSFYLKAHLAYVIGSRFWIGKTCWKNKWRRFPSNTPNWNTRLPSSWVSSKLLL